MKFNEWLDEKRGRLTQVAKKFKVTKGAVSQWRTNGIPKDNMIELSAFTKNAVTLKEMLVGSHGA